MNDSAGAADLVLTPEDLADIANAAPTGTTAGPRYNAAGMARVNV
jgi:hypothetical protein